MQSAPALTVRCAEAGVDVVFVPAPHGCPACGATGLDQSLEDEADTVAANRLIPLAAACRLEDLPRNATAIAAFAREIGVAPGVVLGRMQRMGMVGWSRCGELKVRYEFGD